MYNKLLIAASVLAAAAISGCDTQSDSLAAAYMSPLRYKSYDCDQISMEMDHVGRQSTYLYQSLKKKADNVTAQMAVGLALYWPALFFLEGGDGPEAAQYSQLKGDYEALRRSAVDKKCALADVPETSDEYVKREVEKEADKG